ncbi:phage integrase [Salmonella enterica]|uniref:phage integrase n=1 Tax=Salmonella enterica TaxID=28901 RepID=UPI00296DC66F|nr:hypothetical protein [Salmonella enterica]
MSIKKRPDGKWLVDIRPDGRNGKRVRRLFQIKREAEAFIRYTKRWATQPESATAIKPVFEHYTLHEACEIWWRLVGHTKINAETEKRQLEKTIRQMGDPYIMEIKYTKLRGFITLRLNSGNKYTSIRRDVYRLSGMFRDLVKIGECNSNPIKGVGSLMKECNRHSAIRVSNPDWVQWLGIKQNGNNK